MSTSRKPFVDFRAIRARVTMERVLEHYGVLGTFKRSGSRLSGPCPIHHGSNPTQFRVDTDKNLWNCFSECKHGGNVLDFIAKKEDISIHDAALRACEWFSVPIDEVKTNGSKDEPEAAEDQSQEANAARSAKPASAPPPESTTPNPPLRFRLDKLDRAHPHFAERGITEQAIGDFGLGYFTGDKGLMVGRIAIPINNAKGELVAYAGRWPGNPPDGTPKYKLPTGFRKGLELFNLDRAIQEPPDKPLVIVEGFFDAIKLHQNGCRKVVALMGSTMSIGQEELIRQHTNGQSQVIVMLDEDDAGQARAR
ncbi:MAG TPA: CHC2 zinc finger domain-containing protein [Verrucomicrobiae bacterium]|jgi:DNA primase